MQSVGLVCVCAWASLLSPLFGFKTNSTKKMLNEFNYITQSWNFFIFINFICGIIFSCLLQPPSRWEVWHKTKGKQIHLRLFYAPQWVMYGKQRPDCDLKHSFLRFRTYNRDLQSNCWFAIRMSHITIFNYYTSDKIEKK